VAWATLTQTLEPRLYYLYVPNRDQRLIPVFDTATDFNFAQIFAENRYGGGDRIGDANQADGHAHLAPDRSGDRRRTLRAAFGQRFYFSTRTWACRRGAAQRPPDRFPGLALRPHLPRRPMPMSACSTTRDSTASSASTSAAATSPSRQGAQCRLSLHARPAGTARPAIDISGQWPLFGGWHAVGRFNYSTKDKRMVESVAGLEYDGGCWVGRVVMQRLATQTQASNTALLLPA
jgi:LPS-assembly protein